MHHVPPSSVFYQRYTISTLVTKQRLSPW